MLDMQESYHGSGKALLLRPFLLHHFTKFKFLQNNLMIQSMPDPSLAQPPQRKDLVTLASKICNLLPKTGNTNQIALFVFCDACLGNMELWVLWNTWVLWNYIMSERVHCEDEIG